MILLAPTSHAAKMWGPPINELKKSINYIAIMEVQGIESTEGESSKQLKLLVKDWLHLEDKTKELSLRFKDDGIGEFEIGKEYIVAYSYIRKHAQLRDQYIIDPKGPRVLGIRGMETLAVFENTRLVREAFTTEEVKASTVAEKTESSDIIEKPRSTGKTELNLSQLLDIVEKTTDKRSLRLASLEIMLRSDLVAKKTDIKRLGKALSSSKLDFQLKRFVFEASENLDLTEDKKWLAKIARKAIKQSSPEFDLTSYEPGYILVAIRSLEKYGVDKDVELIAPYLKSNSPSIVKISLNTMDVLDQKRTISLVNQVEIPSNVHSDIKNVIQKYREKNKSNNNT